MPQAFTFGRVAATTSVSTKQDADKSATFMNPTFAHVGPIVPIRSPRLLHSWQDGPVDQVAVDSGLYECRSPLFRSDPVRTLAGEDIETNSGNRMNLVCFTAAGLTSFHLIGGKAFCDRYAGKRVLTAVSLIFPTSAAKIDQTHAFRRKTLVTEMSRRWWLDHDVPERHIAMQDICGVQPAIREEDLLAQSFALFRWQGWTVANKVFHVMAINPFNDQERLCSSRFITEVEMRGQRAGDRRIYRAVLSNPESAIHVERIVLPYCLRGQSAP